MADEKNRAEQSLDSAIPVGASCPAFEYDLSALTRWVCPECGRAIESADVVAGAARSGADSLAHRAALRFVIGGIVVAAGLGLVIWMLTGQRGAAIGAWVYFGCPLPATIVSGWTVAALAPRSERGAWRLAWMRSHLYLHAAWIVVPVGILIGLCGMWIAGKAFNNTYGTNAIIVCFAILALSVWLTASLSGATRCGNVWQNERDRMALTRPRLISAYSALTAAVVVGALVNALVCGGFCMMVIERIMRRW